VPSHEPHPGADAGGHAFAERWVGTVRRECLDHLRIINHRRLERGLMIFVGHYNQHRPHRGLGLVAPDDPQCDPKTDLRLGQLERHDAVGGLIDDYQLVAA